MKKLVSKLKKIVLYTAIYVMLGISRLIILIIPFNKLVKYLGKQEAEASVELSPKRRSQIHKCIQGIEYMSQRAFWRCKCYEQALTCHFILVVFQVPHTVQFGLCKEADATYSAHAWCSVGQSILTGYQIAYLYTRVSAFTYNVKKKKQLK